MLLLIEVEGVLRALHVSQLLRSLPQYVVELVTELFVLEGHLLSSKVTVVGLDSDQDRWPLLS